MPRSTILAISPIRHTRAPTRPRARLHSAPEAPSATAYTELSDSDIEERLSEALGATAALKAKHKALQAELVAEALALKGTIKALRHESQLRKKAAAVAAAEAAAPPPPPPAPASTSAAASAPLSDEDFLASLPRAFFKLLVAKGSLEGDASITGAPCTLTDEEELLAGTEGLNLNKTLIRLVKMKVVAA